MLQQHSKNTPGTGQKDDIPAIINGQQPAALSSGEFVWPADVVAMVGDGDNEAGAKILQKVMNEIRTAKQGHAKQGAPMADLIRKTVRKAKKG